MSIYNMQEWSKDKILLAKLIDAKRYKVAREHAHAIFILSDDTRIVAYLEGMLLTLDIIMEKTR